MSLHIFCGECGKIISYGRASSDWELEYEDDHFGIGPVHGYDGTCSGLTSDNGGGKARVDIPLLHICGTCFKEKMPNAFQRLSK